jgi:hypothetical protein
MRRASRSALHPGLTSPTRERAAGRSRDPRPFRVVPISTLRAGARSGRVRYFFLTTGFLTVTLTAFTLTVLVPLT